MASIHSTFSPMAAKLKGRPSGFELTAISLLAGSCIVIKTLAAFGALRLVKLALEQLQLMGSIPAIENFPRTLQQLVALLTTPPDLGTFIGICIGQVIWKGFERLYFHPLSRFPGPRLAAFTSNFEFYYDVICPGQYTFLLKSMHEKYGPIIRISPSEIHVIDPDFHEQLYTGHSNPRDKWQWATHITGETTSPFSTLSHEQHRKRRTPLNGLFSKRSVAELSESIRSRVEKLCQRIAEYKGSSNPLSLKYAFPALTMDIISDYAFGRSTYALHSPDFEAKKTEVFDTAADSIWLIEFFPIVGKVMHQLPKSLLWLLGPGVVALDKQYMDLEKHVKEVEKKHKSGIEPEKRTIFHELLGSRELPVEDRTTLHLVGQAQAIIGAGITTTAHHLCVTTFYVLSNPQIEQRLRKELQEAIPDSTTLPPLAELEKLEYLTAVIAEGHRFSHGIVHRMPRISPQSPIRYGDWVIPAGWPVGMSPLYTHTNEEIFPSPHEFNPNRFLGALGQKRKKYLIPFGRGTRRCLGENLATAEIYLTLAAVFRRFDMQLFETEEEDMAIAREYLIPLAKKGSKGLRVLVK